MEEAKEKLDEIIGENRVDPEQCEAYHEALRKFLAHGGENQVFVTLGATIYQVAAPIVPLSIVGKSQIFQNSFKI